MPRRSIAHIDPDEERAELLTPRLVVYRNLGDFCTRDLDTGRMIKIWLVFVFIGFMLIWGTFLLSPTLSVITTIPTRSEYDRWLQSTQTEALCSLPIRMVPFVPIQTALVSPLGMGGSRFSRLMRSAVRVSFQVYMCELGVQFARVGKLNDASLQGECAGFFFYGHQILVRFYQFSNIHDAPLYSPEVYVFIRRNPFDAIRSAYNQLRDCDGVESMDCILVRRHRSKMYSDDMLVWDSFVRVHTAEIGQHLRFMRTNATVVIDYETMDTEPLLRLLRPRWPQLPPPEVAAQCSKEVDDEKPVKKHTAPTDFADDLRSFVCGELADVWEEELWAHCLK